jgi:glycosyltransferase involved in cell wall biosynthesis
LTLHDLLQAYPVRPAQGLYGKLRVLAYRLLLARALRRAALILTVHPDVRAEIQRRYSVKAAIEVFYPGLSEKFLKAKLPDREARDGDEQDFGLEIPERKKRVLFFASQDPRKNLQLSFSALAALKKKSSSADHEFCFSVVASDEGTLQLCQELACQHGLKESMEYFSGLSDEALLALYQDHDCLLFPSLAEGFGYPLYEALSQGCSVVSDANRLIPELRSVVPVSHKESEAGMLFHCEAGSEQSVAEALARALRVKSLGGEQRRLIALSIREHLDFSRSAQRLLGFYRQVLARKSAAKE